MARLIAFEPTHIIFDFIDERFDLLSRRRAGHHSAELQRSGYLRARPAPRADRAAAFGRVRAAVAGRAREFAAWCAPRRWPATLILHAARWADDQRLPTAASPRARRRDPPGSASRSRPTTTSWNARRAAFTELMPPMARVDAAAQRLADPATAGA
jgi:hypothetical protein